MSSLNFCLAASESTESDGAGEPGPASGGASVLSSDSPSSIDSSIESPSAAFSSSTGAGAAGSDALDGSSAMQFLNASAARSRSSSI